MALRILDFGVKLTPDVVERDDLNTKGWDMYEYHEEIWGAVDRIENVSPAPLEGPGFAGASTRDGVRCGDYMVIATEEGWTALREELDRLHVPVHDWPDFEDGRPAESLTGMFVRVIGMLSGGNSSGSLGDVAANEADQVGGEV